MECHGSEKLLIVGAEFQGDQEVVALEATSHTYFCEGFAAHNSVAEHSVRVAELVGSPHALEGLLHDAAEAYVVDLPSPIKRMPALAGYRALEDRVQAAIRRRFDLRGAQPALVHVADMILAVTECRDLFGEAVLAKWEIAKTVAPLPSRIEPWDQATAERRFRGAFADAYAEHLAHLRNGAPKKGTER